MIYLEDGEAKIAESCAVDRTPTSWDFKYSLGPAIDCAVEYDCRWKQNNAGIYRVETVGDPFFFVVTPGGQLNVRRTQSNISVLLATGVSKAAVIRGWRSILTPMDDQGLICVYIKSGQLYYKNYAELEDGTMDWSLEYAVPGGLTNCVDLTLVRTNDYRVGILAINNVGSYLINTTRNWVGMAIADHTIDNMITDYLLELTPIMNYVIGDGDYDIDNPSQQGGRFTWEDEYIKTDITDYSMLVLFGGDTLPVLVENVQSIATQEEYEMGSGDGSTTEFETTWYPIVEGSEVVKVNGVTQTINIDYTMNYPNGTIIFNSPPTNGHVILIAHNWYSNGHRVKVTFANGIKSATGLQAQCTVIDGAANNYVVNSTNIGADWADPIPLARFDGSREFIVNTSNFNTCVGDLTVNYTLSAGTLQGEADQDVPSFQLTFTPIGLVLPKVTAGAPVVEVIFNE